MRKLNEIIFYFKSKYFILCSNISLFYYEWKNNVFHNILYYIFKNQAEIESTFIEEKITIFKFAKIIKNLATVFRICLER